MNAIARARAEGALLGLAVGDALGTTLEFEPLPAPAHGERASGPHRDVVGGGPFDVAPGQVTDDTQMACCVASALGDDGLDVAALARSYVAWSRVAFDVGMLTGAAIRRLEAGTLDAGRTEWLARDRRPAPNGSLMRTAPIGVRHARDVRARRRAALDDSALTHHDPRCQLACCVFDAAIAAAVTGAADVEHVLRAAREELDAAADELARRFPSEDRATIEPARLALARDLEAAVAADPGLVEHGPDDRLDVHRSAGFVRVAFRLAFWELAHAGGYEDGVVDVVNRGGDADTNGAIAGALLGAFHGVDSIPGAWRARVLACRPTGPPELATTYHPRVLLDCARRWSGG